ncbi:hypothetical protein LXL04_033661 [Taraxacum kok-saghyz]
MGGGEGREGDWECNGCGNRNYAFRSLCNRCKQPRLLVDPKSHADSKWLPHIADWICTGCTNNNYASREKCKKCGEPKEVAALQAHVMPYFPQQDHRIWKPITGLKLKTKTLMRDPNETFRKCLHKPPQLSSIRSFPIEDEIWQEKTNGQALGSDGKNGDGKYVDTWCLKCWDLLRTHIFPRTRELPQFPISPKPLFLSKNRLRNPPKPVLKQNKKLCTYAQKKSFHICKSFFRKFFFATGLIFERFLAPRSRFFEKVNEYNLKYYNKKVAETYNFRKWQNPYDGYCYLHPIRMVLECSIVEVGLGLEIVEAKRLTFSCHLKIHQPPSATSSHRGCREPVSPSPEDRPPPSFTINQPAKPM